MADTDAARIGDVKAGFVAAKAGENTRLKRDLSNVAVTPEQAASFRAAIGAEGGGGGGGGDVVGPGSATADALALFSGATGKVIKNGPSLGVGAASSVPTRADADARYLLASLLNAANGVAGLGADAKVPTSLLPDAVLGALKWQGAWNATTNSPTIPAAAAGNKGWYYVVNVAGTTSVSGITDWEIGDWLVSNGTAWEKIDNTDQVISVAGLKGIITAAALKTALSLVKADVGLGSVDNTSDANKPVSTAQQAALDLKASINDTIVSVTTSRDLAASDNGKVLEVNSASAVMLTVPSTLVATFNCIVSQVGAGQVTIAAGSGATVNAFGGAKTPGQWGDVSVRVRSTAGAAVVSGGVA